MIIVECDPDEFLISAIGFSKRNIKHGGGKGKVLEIIRKKDGVIGIIDEDPGKTQPKDLENYEIIDATYDLKLLIGKEKKNKKLIQISPYFESWILKRAKENKISLKDYNLPDNPEMLHDIPHIEKKIDFKKFIKELIKNDKGIKILRKWIQQNI